MLWCFWTAKGGAGCSVVAAAIAMRSAQQRDTLLVDLGGDLAAILGVEPPSLGMQQWLMEPQAPPDALSRIEVEVTPGLRLLSFGIASRSLPSLEVVGSHVVSDPKLVSSGGPPLPDPSFKTTPRTYVLARLLQADHRLVIVDVGLRSGNVVSNSATCHEIANMLLAQAQRSTLVTRSCFISLSRATAFEQPTDVVAIFEKGRALRRYDIEQAINAPVVTDLRWDAAVARSVDAGLMSTSLPRSLADLPGPDDGFDERQLERDGLAWPT